MCKFVGYFRVSSQKQGKSGLGLEAQKAAVNAYIGSNQLVAEFTEVETGRNNERPILKEAIAVAKKHKATLIIAKLDRLSRNLAFIANLLDGNIDFIVADMPTANKMTLQMMAVIAEFEAKQISERTRLALKAAKARGVILGNKKNFEEAQKAGQRVMMTQAADHAAKVLPVIKELARNDASSLHRIADALNSRGIQTRRNAVWTGTAVRSIIRKAGFSNLRELVR